MSSERDAKNKYVERGANQVSENEESDDLEMNIVSSPDDEMEEETTDKSITLSRTVSETPRDEAEESNGSGADDIPSMLRRMGKKEKKDSMIRYLTKQGTLFDSFLESSEKKQKPSQGKRRLSVDQGEEESSFLENADESLVHLQFQPSCIQGTMRDYQIAGLNWLVNQNQLGLNSILADEMGLGKTLETISLLGFMKQYMNIRGPHLVLVPLSTLGNWMNEFARFCPSLRPFRLYGSKEERGPLLQEVRSADRSWDVLVTTYEMAIIEKAALRHVRWEYLVIDEAHRVKNENSKLSAILRTFSVESRLLLTGTPLQKNLHELWALLNFLMPEVFGSQDTFHALFNLEDNDNVEEKEKIIRQLHKLIAPFMLRRLKSDVETSLPPKVETVLYVGMSHLQKEMYKKVLVNDFDTIVNAKSERAHLMNLMMQLRKVAGHPYLFDGVEDRSLSPMGEHVVENCGKMVLLDKLLKRMKERGHRVLIFSQMTRVLDIVEDYCCIRQYEYCRIDGSIPSEEREAEIEAFNAPDSSKFVFLLSTRAGGLGINLATADTVILYDSDWNPQMDLQAQDRAHRIGQKREVHVYRLVTEGTVEEHIVERAQMRLRLDALVIQHGRLQEKANLNRDEMLEMIRHGANEVFLSTASSVQDEDIDRILDAGERRTEAMNVSIEKTLPSDEQLMNFKLDQVSIRMYEGVDYTQKKKKRDQELRELMFNEMANQQTRRGRKEITYTENVQKPDVESGRPVKRTIIKLPIMYPWRLFNNKRIEELAQQAQRNYEDSEYDGSGKKWLNEEEEEELEQLLGDGFETWDRRDFSAFVEGCVNFGPSEYRLIADAVGSKTEKEVKEYAESFWSLGKERIPTFEKIEKRVEKSRTKREEIKSYRETAAVKALSYTDPWSMEIGMNRSGFSEEADTLLVLSVALFGWGQWGRVRRAVMKSNVLLTDYYLRTRTEADLCKRAEVLLRAVKKERSEKQEKRRTFGKNAAQEERELREKLRSIEQGEAQTKRELESIQRKIEEQKKKMEKQQSEPKPQQDEAMECGLKAMKIPKSMLLMLLPLLEDMRQGVRGNQHDLDVYIRHHVTMLSSRACKDLLSLVTERRPNSRDILTLRSSLVNTVTGCIDLSKEMEVDEEVQRCCVDLAKERASSPREVIDVKAMVGEWEKQAQENRSRLLEMVTRSGGLGKEELYGEEVMKEVSMTKEEVRNMASRLLMFDKVMNKWVVRSEKKSVKRESITKETDSKSIKTDTMTL